MSEASLQRYPLPFSDQGMYVMRGFADAQIDLVLRAQGRFDYPRLCRALRLFFDAEPVAGCRLVPGWWRGWWVRRADLDEIAPWQLIETEDPEGALGAALQTQVHCSSDPLIHLWLIRGEADTLVLKVSHVLADAGGVKDAAYRISELYRALKADPEYRPEPNLSTRSLRQLLPHLGLRGIWGAWVQGLRNAFGTLRGGLRWSFPSRWPERLGLGAEAGDLRQLVVPLAGPGAGDRFQALKAWGKARGATLNDLVMAAYFRALRRLGAAEARLRATTTADLRLHHLPEGRAPAVCNLSGFNYLDIGRELGASFEETVAKVSAETRRKKAGSIGLGDPAAIAVWAKTFPFAIAGWLAHQLCKTLPRTTPHPPLTNMGPIDASRLDFGELEFDWAYTAVPILFPPLVGFGLSGFKETLTLTAGFCASGIEEAQVREFLESMVAELTELAVQKAK